MLNLPARMKTSGLRREAQKEAAKAMLYKVIGGLVAILVVAVGVWVGAYMYEEAQKADAPRSDKATTANLADRKAGSGKGSALAPRTSASRSAARRPDALIEPGELLVADPPKGFGAAARQMGFDILEVVQLRQLGMEVYRVATPKGNDVDDARKKLAARFPGISIDSYRAFEAQGVKEYQTQTARPLAGWPTASAACGAGVRMGQIDSPVDLSHPALKGQRIEFRSFHKKSRKPGPADHGTAVAAMLVGKPTWGGLLPGAELIAANMFEVNETGKVVGSGLGLLKAIDWMVQKGVQVVNLSVAGGDNKVVRKAFNKARKKGLVLVAAAGNWGSSTRQAFPAAYSDVIAVTALDKRRGIYKKANRGDYIDFAAPGVRIYTAVPRGGRVMSGTSFATPYITVLLAMQIENGATNSPSALRKMMAKRVQDLGDPGRDDIFGWGIVKLRPKCPK
jgi:subtilase family protein